MSIPPGPHGAKVTQNWGFFFVKRNNISGLNKAQLSEITRRPLFKSWSKSMRLRA